MRVDVDLQGKSLDIVLDEQSKYTKRGIIRGKEKVINLLLIELYERRLQDAIVPPAPMDKKQWKKYIKTK